MEVKTVAGITGLRGYSDGKFDEAQFQEPIGIFCDGLGRLLLPEGLNRSIRVLDLQERLVFTLCGNSQDEPKMM